jgi:hypothetical protein
LILGVVALLLGGSALGVALTHAGPAGARGPAGSGTETKWASQQTTQSVSNDTCTVASGSIINFTAIGPGVVALTATVNLLMGHTSGDNIQFEVSLANASAACNPLANHYVGGLVDASAPSATYDQDVNLVQTFSVGATTGNISLDVIGMFTNSFGIDAFSFNGVSVVAVYYPS